MPRKFYAILALILATLACNWSDIVPPAAPVIEPSPLPTFAMPSVVPTITKTPVPTPTSTPEVPIARIGKLGVNCRYGPDKDWGVVSTIPAEMTAEIKGRTVDTAWWYIKDPQEADRTCWVSYDVVETAGNMNIIPIAEVPEISVTELTVDTATSFSACGSANEVTFSSSITTEFPATVTYQWKVEGETLYTSPKDTLEMTEAGTQKLPTETYKADCGDYTVTLLIIRPNEASIEKEFKVQAP